MDGEPEPELEPDTTVAEGVPPGEVFQLQRTQTSLLLERANMAELHPQFRRQGATYNALLQASPAAQDDLFKSLNLNWKQRRDGERYDTVCGFTQTDIKLSSGKWGKNPECPRSKVYIVYENGRAYPEYVVRYYQGARDSARTPYATKAEAPVSAGWSGPGRHRAKYERALNRKQAELEQERERVKQIDARRRKEQAENRRLHKKIRCRDEELRRFEEYQKRSSSTLKEQLIEKGASEGEYDEWLKKAKEYKAEHDDTLLQTHLEPDAVVAAIAYTYEKFQRGTPHETQGFYGDFNEHMRHVSTSYDCHRP
eukprot:COSAG05_NODE_4_length_49189_cov_157.128784_36_plen_311_part_00